MELKEVKKIIEEKVRGKWIPCHDEYGHHYLNTDTGIKEDSVTTKNIIQKPHLIPWAVGLAIDFLEKPGNFELLSTDQRDDIIKSAKLQHTDVRDDAGNVGTIAHDAIESYIRQWINTDKRPEDIRSFLKADDDPRAYAAARSAEKVFDKLSVVPVDAEFVVGRVGHGAGTLDLLVLTSDGKLELWDWKTSNGVDDFYACQGAAYTRFFEHMTGLKISKIRIFKISKANADFKEYIVKDIRKSYQIFKASSLISDWLHDKKPKLVENKKILKL